jgi:putative ABC transport system ATP-binding protein
VLFPSGVRDGCRALRDRWAGLVAGCGRRERPPALQAPEPGAVAIVLRAVTRSYRRGFHRELVLRGIHLTVRAGQCVFLVGPSGSGKSTLLSIMGGILQPDEGDVELLGINLSRASEDQRAYVRGHLVGFLFQRFHLLRGLTAEENVMVPLLLRGVPERQARKRARERLQQVGLDSNMHLNPRFLSVGQCQRVALARALVHDPPLVLADEPTAALDASSGQQAMHLLADLARTHGKTVVVVTHDTRIFPFADEIYELRHGQLQPWPSPKEGADG